MAPFLIFFIFFHTYGMNISQFQLHGGTPTIFFFKKTEFSDTYYFFKKYFAKKKKKNFVKKLDIIMYEFMQKTEN